jgi:cytoskeleton protein RodZ
MSDTLGLRNWRQRKGISLETIAASTKLSVRQLEAIESGEFRKLPGGIYNTSYIRQYARAIDFDEAEMLAWYHDSQKSEAANPPEEKTRPRISGALFQN